MWGGVVGVLPCGDKVDGLALLQSACVEQGAVGIEVGVPRLGIARENVDDEGELVPVDARLTPDQRPENDQNDDGKARASILPFSGYLAVARASCRFQDRR